MSDKAAPRAEQTAEDLVTGGAHTVGALLADMNREIRTSMNGVLGMLDMLLDTQLDDAQQHYAKAAQNSAGSLLDAIEHAIDLSLIDSGRIALAAAPFDLRQEMETACSTKDKAASTKGLTLQLAYPPPLRLVGDAARVRQMIACLARAAIATTDSGSIAVRANTSDAGNNRRRIRVEVRMEALSAAGEALAALLNLPASAGAEALRARPAGTGELVLCAHLARAMEGRIGVDRTEQDHVCFFFSIELPLAQQTSQRHAPVRERRVLVADDNPVNQQVALHMLKKLGCHADAAADGEQAVELHAAAPYDLILMDCDMPRLDGYAATRRLRALESGDRRVAVIALTACTTSEERRAATDAGMDDFLAKPIRPQVLGEMLARWLPQDTTADMETAAPRGEDELDEVKAMFGADFAELAALYLNDSPPRIAGLRSAHADDDPVRLAKLAHALAGSSASIGATGLCKLSRELEMHVKQDMAGDIGTRVAAIEAEYRRVENKILTLLR